MLSTPPSITASAAPLPAPGRVVEAAGGGAAPPSALADAAALSAVAQRLSRSNASLRRAPPWNSSGYSITDLSAGLLAKSRMTSDRNEVTLA